MLKIAHRMRLIGRYQPVYHLFLFIHRHGEDHAYGFVLRERAGRAQDAHPLPRLYAGLP